VAPRNPQLRAAFHRRKGWRSRKVLRAGSGECAEKCRDVSDFCVRQNNAQLNAAHYLHGLMERRYRSIVEVWGCHRHVSETWNLEGVQVSWVFGESESALVDLGATRRLPVFFHHSKFLKHLASHSHPL